MISYGFPINIFVVCLELMQEKDIFGFLETYGEK